MITAAQARIIAQRKQLRNNVVAYVHKEITQASNNGLYIFTLYTDYLDKHFNARHLDSRSLNELLNTLANDWRAFGFVCTVWPNKIIFDWSK